MLNGRSGPRKTTRRTLSPEAAAAKEAEREKRRARTYKVSPERQRALAEYQGHRCWGCPATGRARVLSMDHNHRTGEVRMYLCNACNNIVGHFRDNPERLIRLGLAVINPPSRRAWLAPGAVAPGWETQDSELLDLVREDV